jgi:hypothetical protein
MLIPDSKSISNQIPVNIDHSIRIIPRGAVPEQIANLSQVDKYPVVQNIEGGGDRVDLILSVHLISDFFVIQINPYVSGTEGF